MASSQWLKIHTTFGIILLICLVSVFKNAYIYFEDYASALGLTSFGYSIIMLACYLGNISSLFFGIFVNKLFSDKYHCIASIFSFLSGLLSLLFGFSVFMPNNIVTIVYGSFIAFFYKNCASICYTTVVGLANEYSIHDQKGSNISYLQLSWSVSTLLYIPVGYMIEFVNWYLSFLIFGIILICYCFIINFGFKFDNDSYNALNDAVSDIQSNISSISIAANITDLKQVFNRKIILILCSIFFCGIASGSFLITTTSFWMEDVYLLTTSEVGWYTLSIFIAEMCGSIIMSQISDQYGIFVCSFIAFSIKIIDCLIIFNLSILIGPNIGGLWLAVILNFFLFVGWEMFFITQILAMIEFGPINVSKNIILLSNFAVASTAKMIGTELSALLWYNGKGLQILSCIWLCTNIAGAACYALLYKIKDQRLDYLPIPDSNNKQNTTTTTNPTNTTINVDGQNNLTQPIVSGDINNEKSRM